MADPEDGTTGQREEPIRIEAQDARGAEIILKKRRNRMIFIAGLVGFVLLMVAVRCAGMA